MSAKKIAKEIAEALRERDFEVDETDAWPGSDFYLYVTSGHAEAAHFRLTAKEEVFSIGGAYEPVLEAIKDLGFKIKKDKKRTVFIAFEIITPESAERGDFSEAGEEDEQEVVPSYDETFASAAVKFLRDSGAHPADGADWFETGFSDDYRTGESENNTFHLRGFTEEEENVIWTEMGRRRRR